MSDSNIPNTALWRARRQSGLERKQSAWLVGNRSPDSIARYERGETEPSLDKAIRLSIIYGCGMEELFPLKYELFRRELAKKAVSLGVRHANLTTELIARLHVCTYEDALGDDETSAEYFPYVRDHVTRLAKRLAGL